MTWQAHHCLPDELAAMVVDVAGLQCPRGVLNGGREPCVLAGLLTRGVAMFSQGF